MNKGHTHERPSRKHIGQKYKTRRAENPALDGKRVGHIFARCEFSERTEPFELVKASLRLFVRSGVQIPSGTYHGGGLFFRRLCFARFTQLPHAAHCHVKLLATVNCFLVLLFLGAAAEDL